MAILGMDELSEENKIVVARASNIQRFISQPFSVASVFAGVEGKFVPLEKTIANFKPIWMESMIVFQREFLLSGRNRGSCDEVKKMSESA